MFSKLFLVMTLLTFQSVVCGKQKKIIKKLKADVETLDGRVRDLEGERETYEGRFRDLEEERETLEGWVRDIEEERGALESRVRDIEEKIDISRDCQDVQERGINSTGVYTISPKSGSSFEVRCDMDTADGGWTVIQRRVSSSDFYKTWDEYKTGFGDLDGNFWLGNDNIYTLTSSGNYRLRVDLTAPDGETGYATYSSFSTGIEADKYRLSIDGYSGNIGDSLDYHNGMAFSTNDRDNDEYRNNCAEIYSGAWWYGACHHSNLNGLYGSSESGKGLNWGQWKGNSMSRTQLAIKRV